MGLFDRFKERASSSIRAAGQGVEKSIDHSIHPEKYHTEDMDKVQKKLEMKKAQVQLSRAEADLAQQQSRKSKYQGSYGGGMPNMFDFGSPGRAKGNGTDMFDMRMPSASGGMMGMGPEPVKKKKKKSRGSGKDIHITISNGTATRKRKKK